MSLNNKIYVFYDARPFIPNVKAYLCEIDKHLKTGFKVKNIDFPGLYEDVIFKQGGGARGWQTLSWMPTWHAQSQSDYDILRARMKDEKQQEG